MAEPVTVKLLCIGNYSDKRVLGVFTDEELLAHVMAGVEESRARSSEKPYVEEVELNPGRATLERGLKFWWGIIEEDGNIERLEDQTWNWTAHNERENFIGRGPYRALTHYVLVATFWAKDREAAIRELAGRRRAYILANKWRYPVPTEGGKYLGLLTPKEAKP